MASPDRGARLFGLTRAIWVCYRSAPPGGGGLRSGAVRPYLRKMSRDDPTAPDAGLAPDLAQIEALAHEAVDALPEPFRAYALGLVIRVEEMASDDVLQGTDCESPFELTGLYEGVPLTEKSVSDQPLQPDMIWLFRRAILDEWIERGNVTLRQLVGHVMVHELAHHFGWTDEEIAAIDPWWEI